MVFSKEASTIFSVLKVIFFSLKFVGVFFVGTVSVEVLFVISIISSQIITESLIILAKYSPFSHVHVEGFQR